MKHRFFSSLGRIIPPAAFGRLCVETWKTNICMARAAPAAFGRLCVETGDGKFEVASRHPSRLRAAVC